MSESSDPVAVPAAAVPDAVEEMNALHIQIGRKAAQLALEVLEEADLSDAPFASVVALLKFGVELERKAVLGSEDDADDGGVDPFEKLAKTLTTPTESNESPSNESPKEE